MTDKEMLKTLIDCYDQLRKAKIAYINFSGNEKRKNELFKVMQRKETELDNAVFNIRQLIK